jgi:hypothetical protein
VRSRRNDPTQRDGGERIVHVPGQVSHRRSSRCGEPTEFAVDQMRAPSDGARRRPSPR